MKWYHYLAYFFGGALIMGLVGAVSFGRFYGG